MNIAIYISIATLLFGSGCLWTVLRYINTMRKEVDAIRFGVQAFLRSYLLEEAVQSKEKGYMSYDKKEAWLNAYAAYHNLGNNGVMDKVKAEVLELDTFKEN